MSVIRVAMGQKQTLIKIKKQVAPGVTVGVDQLYSVRLQECFQGFFGLWRPAFPIRATKAVPYGSKTDFIRVGVLDDKPFQPVWSPCDDAEAHRAAVVLKIQPEVTKTGLSEKRLDYFGGLGEGVGELRRVWHVGVAEARIVRRN